MNIRVVDSHTGGEPTRIVVEGAPDLGSGDMAQRLAVMKSEADWLRTALVTEPRGSECMVGAVLQEPISPAATAGVIFFNNIGYLGMCGHGMIGLVATLAHLARIEPGEHLVETPVGNVKVHLSPDGGASFQNVLSYRYRTDVKVDVPGLGMVTGDIAWGGNWFFLTPTQLPIDLEHLEELLSASKRIRAALDKQNVTGENGAVIDHIELVGAPHDPQTAHARNFVLCPGGEYDRSPCGTGTSAKLACLAATGCLKPGETWRQESVTGSVFEGSYQPAGEGVIPTIKGRAYVNAELQIILQPDDPLRYGIRSTKCGG
jgi:4-hydroxyproline epimerase